MRHKKILLRIFYAAGFAALNSWAFAARAAPYEVLDLTPPDFSSAEIAGVIKPPFMYVNPNPADPIRLVGSGEPANGGTAHALLWTGLNNQPLDLNPTGFTWSVILAADGNLQELVGGGATQDGERPLALLWKQSTNSSGSYKATDLTPKGFSWAQIYDVSESMRVGWGVPTDGNQPHALIWNGDDADSVKDLNLQGFIGSGAYAVGSYDVVGMAIPPGDQWDSRHAFFWMGLAHKPIDLNPSGFTMSEADAIYEPGGKIEPDVAAAGAWEVGTGTPPSSKFSHALLWQQQNPAAVDLNPAGFDSSKAVAITSNEQAGWGNPAGSSNTHALVWNSTAASCIDLHQFLPIGYTDSVATCIDSDGDVFGSATDASGRVHAIEWKYLSPTAGEASNSVDIK
ncbi:MAG TPA: hypothetical protein VMG59_10840 [Phycisphaerae bacterium]|nr:hypothetical protein [Phycisphaerae bacterium]